MANWQSLNEVDEDWWELAYKLFLSNDPIKVILNHANFYMMGDKWNDFGFSCDTHIPPTGKFHDVSRRAVLVVISRTRNMHWGTWNKLNSAPSKPVPDLQESDKQLINCITDLMYNKDGSPRPYNG